MTGYRKKAEDQETNTPLKKSGKCMVHQGFSDVIRGYRKRPVSTVPRFYMSIPLIFGWISYNQLEGENLDIESSRSLQNALSDDQHQGKLKIVWHCFICRPYNSWNLIWYLCWPSNYLRSLGISYFKYIWHTYKKSVFYLFRITINIQSNLFRWPPL